MEFALVVPIFLILVMGIVDFGMGFKTSITVTNAAREGARFGAVGWPAGSYPADCNDSATDDITVVGRTCSALGVSQATLTEKVQSVSVTYVERNGIPETQTGDSLVVSMTYKYDFITPLGSMLSTFTGGSIPATLTLESTTDMRLE